MPEEINKRALQLVVSNAGSSFNTKRGLCERHGHYCVQLDVARAASRLFGAMCLVTAEEKSALWNGLTAPVS